MTTPDNIRNECAALFSAAKGSEEGAFIAKLRQLEAEPELLSAVLTHKQKSPYGGFAHTIAEELVGDALHMGERGYTRHVIYQMLGELVKSARSVPGLAEKVLKEQSANSVQGTVLEQAISVDSISGVSNMDGIQVEHPSLARRDGGVTKVLLDAIADDQQLVSNLLVSDKNLNAYGDTFLHCVIRSCSTATLQLGLGLLQEHGLLHEAYQQRNEVENTPLHLAAYRGHKAAAALALDAIKDDPAFIVQCLTTGNRNQRTPCDYGEKYGAGGAGEPEQLAETQQFLQQALQDAGLKLGQLAEVTDLQIDPKAAARQ